MSSRAWLVSVDNGEEYSDHSTTPVAVCSSEDEAKRLEAAINEWIGLYREVLNGARDYGDERERIASFLQSTPWPLGCTAPSDATPWSTYSAPKAWVVELPTWSRP